MSSKLSALIGASIIALALGAGCSSDDDDVPHNDGTTPPRDGGVDGNTQQCPRPKLELCKPPGTQPGCPDNWFCPGCRCEGMFKAAACHPVTDDCRRFCDGCFPDEYCSCGNVTDPCWPYISGRCGYCFPDGGPLRPECDKLKADAGA